MGRCFISSCRLFRQPAAASGTTRRVLSFELTGASRRSLEEAGDGRSAEAVITGRPSSATHVLPRLERTNGGATLTAEEFHLVGDQVELVLMFTNGNQLRCTRTEIQDFEELERWRQDEYAITLDGAGFRLIGAAVGQPA